MNGYDKPTVFVHPFRRTLSGLTWVDYDDVRGDAAQPGTTLIARNPHNDRTATAVVVRLNRRRERIYLAVAWKEMRKACPPTPQSPFT